jgi:hypothetical protein
VVDAASDVLVEVLGESGRHTRFSVGVASLPAKLVLKIAVLFIDGHATAPDDRDAINHWFAQPFPSPTLHTNGTRHLVAPENRELPPALSAIARDVIDLLTVHDDRLRNQLLTLIRGNRSIDG